MPTLVYLHGFLSSSASKKATITQKWLSQNEPAWKFFCPDLPSNPVQVIEALHKLFNQLSTEPDVALIGSSLGGFWATYIAEKYSLPAVLVNPAVAPHTRFAEFEGKPLKHYYSDEICVLQPEDLNVLLQCDIKQHKNINLYWLMAQKGDEVLNYRLAELRYEGAKQTIENGGNHGFVGYESWLPEIIEFFKSRF